MSQRKKLIPSSIFAARDRVLAALDVVCWQVATSKFTGRWWFEPDSTIADVRNYAVTYGRAHLREWTAAIATVAEAGDDFGLADAELVLDLNSGPSLIGLHALFLGDASSLVAVDWAPAAGGFLNLLARELDLVDRVRFETSVAAATLPAAESVAVIASHALNVRYGNQAEQVALDAQNLAALTLLCEHYRESDVVLASLEPAASRARGLMTLAEPWRQARFDVRTNAVGASPPKFCYGADSVEVGTFKRFAATRVEGPFVPLSHLPVAEEFGTPFATRRLSFAPSQPTRLADLGCGPIEAVTEAHALAWQLDFLRFRDDCDNAARVEREELFGEPFEPSTRWAEAIALLEDFAGGVR